MSLRQGFGGKAPNIFPNREAIKEKRPSGSEAIPGGESSPICGISCTVCLPRMARMAACAGQM